MTKYLLTFFILAASQLVLATDLETRMGSLLGRSAAHDGPNCYNAVSYAQGFTDILNQTSGMELKYHLQSFCQPIDDVSAKGDVAVVIRAGVYEHAAILAAAGQIFEKSGLAGQYGFARDRKESARYQIKSVSESRYFQNCGKNCEVRTYRCDAPEKNQKKISSCQQSSVYKGIQTIQSMLMYMAFTSDLATQGEVPVLSEFVDQESQKMALVEPQDPCSLYYLASWNSIVWHLGSLQAELTNRSMMENRGQMSLSQNFDSQYLRRYQSFYSLLRSSLKDSFSQEILREP